MTRQAAAAGNQQQRVSFVMVAMALTIFVAIALLNSFRWIFSSSSVAGEEEVHNAAGRSATSSFNMRRIDGGMMNGNQQWGRASHQYEHTVREGRPIARLASEKNEFVPAISTEELEVKRIVRGPLVYGYPGAENRPLSWCMTSEPLPAQALIYKDASQRRYLKNDMANTSARVMGIDQAEATAPGAVVFGFVARWSSYRIGFYNDVNMFVHNRHWIGYAVLHPDDRTQPVVWTTLGCLPYASPASKLRLKAFFNEFQVMDTIGPRGGYEDGMLFTYRGRHFIVANEGPSTRFYTIFIGEVTSFIVNGSGSGRGVPDRFDDEWLPAVDSPEAFDFVADPKQNAWLARMRNTNAFVNENDELVLMTDIGGVVRSVVYDMDARRVTAIYRGSSRYPGLRGGKSMLPVPGGYYLSLAHHCVYNYDLCFILHEDWPPYNIVRRSAAFYATAVRYVEFVRKFFVYRDQLYLTTAFDDGDVLLQRLPLQAAIDAVMSAALPVPGDDALPASTRARMSTCLGPDGRALVSGMRVMWTSVGPVACRPVHAQDCREPLMTIAERFMLGLRSSRPNVSASDFAFVVVGQTVTVLAYRMAALGFPSAIVSPVLDEHEVAATTCLQGSRVNGTGSVRLLHAALSASDGAVSFLTVVREGRKQLWVDESKEAALRAVAHKTLDRTLLDDGPRRVTLLTALKELRLLDSAKVTYVHLELDGAYRVARSFVDVLRLQSQAPALISFTVVPTWPTDHLEFDAVAEFPLFREAGYTVMEFKDHKAEGKLFTNREEDAFLQMHLKISFVISFLLIRSDFVADVKHRIPEWYDEVLWRDGSHGDY